MASRNLFCSLVFFLTTLAPICAQTVSYHIELRFVQRLAWVGDEYAMRYEVIIEKEDEGKYNGVLRKFTDALSIEVSLPSGKYRCQVIPYDYLDQPVPTSEWVNFEVLPGNEKLSLGEHEIIIGPPRDETGWTETIILAMPEAEQNTKKDQKQFNIYLGTVWAPLFFTSNENLTLYGAGVRFGLISTIERFLNPGIELVASWRTYEADTGSQMAQSLTSDFNFLMQTRFFGGRADLNFRLGMGFSFLPSNHLESTEDQFVHMNFGVSFIWLPLPLKNLYVEADIDYSQFLTKGYFGLLRPWIGLGLRL